MIAHATPLADWVIVLPVVLGLMGAALLLMLRRFIGIQAWVCAGVLLGILACDASLMQRALAEGPLSMTMGRWLPPFGISFAADAMGAGFALVAALVTLPVVLFLQMDTPEAARRDGIYPLILLLVAGVSGAFLTGDIFNLYVWFEVTLISTFGLIVLAGNPLQIDAAVKYGVLNFIATTLFLMALGLLYGLLGTLNMADIVTVARSADPAALAAIAALLMLAFGIKAAAFPVNAWLPATYHVPPAGIAALIAGLLTKVGAYALIRTLLFLLPATLATLEPVLLAAAVATMIVGPLGAIAETNLRRAIGFILVGGIGVIVAALALPSASSVAGAVLYVVHAILTLTALYLVAGLIEKASPEPGTILAPYKRNLSILFFVLLLSIAGVPPFLGFWPKLLLLQGFVGDAGIVHDGFVDWRALLLVAAVLLNALFTLIGGMRLWIRVFWRDEAVQGTSPRFGFGLAAAALLTLLVFGAGLWPDRLVAAALLAANGLLDPSAYIAAVGLSP